MPRAVTTGAIDALAPAIADLCTGWAARALPDLVHADVRLAVTEAKMAAAENGEPKFASDDYACALGVRVLARRRAVAAGYAGQTLGAADLPRLAGIVREAMRRAHGRAIASAEGKAQVRAELAPLGASLADTRLGAVPPARDRVPARYGRDPRAVPLDEIVRVTTDIAREVRAVDPRLAFSHVGTHTELGRELYCSSAGALVDQSVALTQGVAYVVAATPETSQELYDVIGHQRGWEVVLEGAHDGALELPDLRTFALALAREAAELAAAPPLPSTDGEVVVVTDPHYNALVAHEIVGHPSELDRGLKLETAYAGRSWLLRALEDTQVGRRVASALVSAYSDPALPGYGHYRYDDEGTPGRRVTHLDAGIFTEFLNSRQTAAVLGAEPNGHYKASEACLVPLIRMSTTVFAPGADDPAAIVRDVEHGYYLAGHRIPSIAESRENFLISARRVREIRHGELGRLYRDGGILADSREYLMGIDAVGTDFRIYPIPNCGKGQPMQTKRLGNGGPTMRSRARLVGPA
ncbi:MAG TPA: TldD/PmbA family protein [Methylomirabilota bacterium]|nr:TldD/PmbA family protein [Methylomirabilota bacterium]